MLTQENPLIFGHRGCRGIYPENTIRAFEHALNVADGIEWDVVVNADKQLVISHEPYMNSAFCLDSNGNEIPKSKEKEYNMYRMTQQQINRFDCGTKTNAKFPRQQAVSSYKPLVQEAFKELSSLKGKTILFEVKSEVGDYGTYQPEPKEFAQIIYQEVVNSPYLKDIVFMCFDPAMLEELHTLFPNQRMVYLTYTPAKNVSGFLKDLSFTPYALGMYYPTISKREVAKAHSEGVLIYAWTVNKNRSYQRLKRAGVDGIITDYPGQIPD